MDTVSFGSSVMGIFEEEKENSTEEIIKDENDKNNSSNENYNYIGILEIPKINLKNGFFDINSRYNNVDYNVTIIKGSTFPGTQNNNLILAAHSGNCPVCYFDKLYKLQLNDEAYLFYNNIKTSSRNISRKGLTEKEIIENFKNSSNYVPPCKFFGYKETSTTYYPK